MKAENIWIAFTKSRPLPGCDLDLDGCEFYFCEAYIPVSVTTDPQNTFEEIIGKTRNALLDSKFELVDVSKIIRFDPHEWEVIGDTGNDVHELAKSTETSQKTILSSFRSEEVEEETQYRHAISELD